MRSIPEKTLEHWTSIYLSNRFPGGALWWPTSGEDVLVELPRLASSEPGVSVALELKTTEARGADHVLEIDTHQLARYLNPPSGRPLPVYYVFPTPHWIGPLTSRSGASPSVPTGSASAPPGWWRRRVGPAWFGDWLYVLSARSVAAALPRGWDAPRRTKATLLTWNDSHVVGRVPDWGSLLGLSRSRYPVNWTQFWKLLTSSRLTDGVIWRAYAGKNDRPGTVRVLYANGEGGYFDAFPDRVFHNQEFPDQESPDQPLPAVEPVSLSGADREGTSVGGDERLLLHIPASVLADR